jgi:hypothetical protein
MSSLWPAFYGLDPFDPRALKRFASAWGVLGVGAPPRPGTEGRESTREWEAMRVLFGGIEQVALRGKPRSGLKSDERATLRARMREIPALKGLAELDVTDGPTERVVWTILCGFLEEPNVRHLLIQDRTMPWGLHWEPVAMNLRGGLALALLERLQRVGRGNLRACKIEECRALFTPPHGAEFYCSKHQGDTRTRARERKRRSRAADL